MKYRNSSRAFLAFAFLLFVCCSGILPALSLRDSQTVSSYGTVVYSRAIQVPPDGYCYHSAYVQSVTALPSDVEDAINNFINMVEKGLYSYTNAGGLCWTEGFWMIEGNVNNFKPLIDNGLVRALSIILEPAKRDPTTGIASFTDDQTVKDIAAGLYDSYITTIATQCKTFAYPLIIRFGTEMNINEGNEYWNGAWSYGRNPADFIAAWKRVVDIFRLEGASNAIFVWNPNCGDIGPHHWTEYYPGDDYVDWVGIDLYQYQPDSDPNTLMAGIYDDYYARKPIMIAEWGANWEGQNYSDSDRAAFINMFFDAIESRPKIKLICYWYTGDFKFDSSTLPLATGAYANRISDQRYITCPP